MSTKWKEWLQHEFDDYAALLSAYLDHVKDNKFAEAAYAAAEKERKDYDFFLLQMTEYIQAIQAKMDQCEQEAVRRRLQEEIDAAKNEMNKAGIHDLSPYAGSLLFGDYIHDALAIGLGSDNQTTTRFPSICAFLLFSGLYPFDLPGSPTENDSKRWRQIIEELRPEEIKKCENDRYLTTIADELLSNRFPFSYCKQLPAIYDPTVAPWPIETDGKGKYWVAGSYSAETKNENNPDAKPNTFGHLIFLGKRGIQTIKAFVKKTPATNLLEAAVLFRGHIGIPASETLCSFVEEQTTKSNERE